MNVFSFGGGVQSTACLVLAAQGDLDIKTFLFANVGEDSEHPATLKYVRDVAMPYASQHSIELIELFKVRKSGEQDTLYKTITRPQSRSVPIPMRMANGAPGNRSCTADFKIKVIAKWLREHGATPKNPTIVNLGISLDEYQRMRTSPVRYQINAYPLIDRRLNRQDCMNIIRHAGLSVPPKSSCWFCPFHRQSVWQEMAEKEPELFQRACELEQFVNERRAKLDLSQVWLSGKHVPLRQIISHYNQQSLFEYEATCDIAGYCGM